MLDEVAVLAHQAETLEQAYLSIRHGHLATAGAMLRGLLQKDPRNIFGWMAIGETLERAGLQRDAVRARSQALRHGRAAGYFMNMATTPVPLQPVIQGVIADANRQLFEVVGQGLDQLHARHGAQAIKRVVHAMHGFLGRVQDLPASPHQVPKFLFFPGLPPGPYHDPALQPWSATLVDAYDAIRAEALEVMRDNDALEDFLTFKPGQSKQGYLGGDGARPAWDAFFFYRHGERYDANHARCPRTSALLDNIELCAVEGQAPEICFSVLQPGTTIMPHHGVTNTRLVYHLPLIVPEQCALNVFGGGEHHWREREPMMFDDTYKHEAWNRSAHTRIILLMDCWNPHLTPVERAAVKVMVELISAYENFSDRDVEAVLARMNDAGPANA
jgi:aspartate beta-hydroxylase